MRSLAKPIDPLGIVSCTLTVHLFLALVTTYSWDCLLPGMQPWPPVPAQSLGDPWARVFPALPAKWHHNGASCRMK